MSDSLDELIVDENLQPDLDLLAKILRGKIKINTEGKMIFSEEARGYPDWKKILICMLAKKVAVIKNLGKEMKEASMPKEIGEMSFVSGDNVGRRLADELKDIAIKNKDGYFIPNYNLTKCEKLLGV